jgi:hypothetical protein
MSDFNVKFISAPYECSFGSSTNVRIEHTIVDKDVDLDSMLQQFQYFLMACGYPIRPSQELMLVDEYEDEDEDEDDAQDLSGVTRVEVIDRVGRAYTNYGVSLVALEVQDEGRTLKVFVN